MKNKYNYKILDCTLRDGGYYTNWTFDRYLVERYLQTLKRNKINYVEIGFKFLKNEKYIGQFGHVNEKLINWACSIAINNYGVMINASEFKNFSKFKIKEKIEKNFLPKKKSKMKFVRIASHISEVSTVKILAKNLKNLGYKVFVNLMQITMIEYDQFANFYKNLKPYFDTFYIADSLGSLRDKNKIKKICSFLNKEKKEFGIHAHDNQGLALTNTLEFKKYGAKWLDSTMLGMGRGPGNVDTIKLAKSLKRRNNNFNATKKDFNLLKRNYRWGKNIYYKLAAENKIHPTYIQEILGYKDLKKEFIFNYIKYLKKYPTHHYSTSILENAISSINDSAQNLFKLKLKSFKNKDILILGSSESLFQKYFIEVENFINKKKPIVLSLNFGKGIFEKYVNFYITSHLNRVFANEQNIKKNLKNVIMPFKPKILNKLSKKIIVYPLVVKKNTFKHNKKNCVLPNMLSFSYAIAISKFINSKNIYLAGFDGYLNNKDIRKNFEMSNTIKIIENSIKNKFISITPSIYPIENISSEFFL